MLRLVVEAVSLTPLEGPRRTARAPFHSAPRYGRRERMAAHQTVSNRIAKLLLAAVTAQGGEPSELLASVGLEPEDLEDPEGRISLEAEGRLWTEAARLVGDDA